MRVSKTSRIAAGAAALVGLLPFYGVAFFTFVGAAPLINRPDASEPNGDPCCLYPHSWGEVALGTVGTLVGSLASAAIAVGLWWLASVALRGRVVRLRLRPRLVAAGLGGTVLLIAAYLLVVAAVSPLWA